jgi:hypothetical protein
MSYDQMKHKWTTWGDEEQAGLRNSVPHLQTRHFQTAFFSNILKTFDIFFIGQFVNIRGKTSIGRKNKIK